MANGDTDYGWIKPAVQHRVWSHYEDSWIQAFEDLRDDVLKDMGFWKPSDARANQIVNEIRWEGCRGWTDVRGGYEYTSAVYSSGYGILRRVVVPTE